MLSPHHQPQTQPRAALPLQSLIAMRMASSAINNRATALALGPSLGQFRARQRGHGLDFDDLRAYTHGDDVRHIDWKVSARYNQLHSRVYREEKDHTLTLAVDFSDGMFTGSQRLRAVHAGLFAARLAWYTTGAGGRCALLVQSHENTLLLPASKGDRGALAICSALAQQFDFAAKRHNQSEQPKTTVHDRSNLVLHRLLERLSNTSRQHHNVILISGCDGVTDTANHAVFKHNLTQLANTKQVSTVLIEDRIERDALPSGIYTYQSTHGVKTLRINAQLSTQLQQQLDKQRTQLAKLFTEVGIPMLSVYNENRDNGDNGDEKTHMQLVQLGVLP